MRIPIAVAAMLVVAAPVSARPAECSVVIDGLPYIRGACDYLPTGPDIQIGNAKSRYRVYIEAQPDGTYVASWNEGRGDNIAEIGVVTRGGGCWVSDRARICADERRR